MEDIKLYFWDVETDEDVPGDNPISVSLNDALDRFNNLSKLDGSFIGMEFSGNRVVQFMYNGDDSIYLDVIDPATHKTFGRDTTNSEANRIIRDVYYGNDPLKIKDLESSEIEFVDHSEAYHRKDVLTGFTLFCLIFLSMWFIERDWGNPFTSLASFVHCMMYTIAVAVPLIALILFIIRRTRR